MRSLWDRWYAVMGRASPGAGTISTSTTTRAAGCTIRSYSAPSTTIRRNSLAAWVSCDSVWTGFVSADADHKGAGSGRRLSCSAATDCDSTSTPIVMGTAFVELQDADGKPHSGFALADCEEIGGNFIDQRVYWNGSPDVSSLAGRPVRMHFVLKRAKLYAFQFSAGQRNRFTRGEVIRGGGRAQACTTCVAADPPLESASASVGGRRPGVTMVADPVSIDRSDHSTRRLVDGLRRSL